MEKITKPHDKFFKKAFEDIEVARDFMLNYLPNDIIKIIDIEQLSYEKDSFIEKEFEQYYSDILFKTAFNNKPAYIYCLIEHKSYPAKNVALQLLRYMVSIWEKNTTTENAKLPFILPIVIYHGKTQWSYDLGFISLIENIKELPKSMIKYIPNFEYIIYDLSPYGSTEIKGSIKAQLVMKILRTINTDIETFLNALIEVVILMEKLEEKETITEYFEVFLRYVLNAREDISYEDIVEKIANVSKKEW